MKQLGSVFLFVALGLSLSACSSWFSVKTDHENQTIEQPATNTDKDSAMDSLPPTDNTTDNTSGPISENPAPEQSVSEQSSPEAQVVDVTLNKKSYIDEKYHDPSAASASSNSEASDTTIERADTTYSRKSNGVDPDKALRWLKNGNKRFLKGSLRADGQSKKDIRRLQKSEKPHAVVFASSDSRIPPEIIFDEKLGEIYVIRNLGLTVDNSVLNSIDYAIGELGTRLVVVLDRTYPGSGIDFTHADETMQKLVDRSPVLKSALESKNVKVIPAIYNISTGKVKFGK